VAERERDEIAALIDKLQAEQRVIDDLLRQARELVAKPIPTLPQPRPAKRRRRKR
jgi:hypothetical protein